MVSQLLESPEGQAQMAQVKGGFRALCQGPEEGNILIHIERNTGPLSNPGWCMSDTHHHTGTAQEYLLDGVRALTEGKKVTAVTALKNSIIADELGHPTADSAHANYELAMVMERDRQLAKANDHFNSVLKSPAEPGELQNMSSSRYTLQSSVQISQKQMMERDLQGAALSEKLKLTEPNDLLPFLTLGLGDPVRLQNGCWIQFDTTHLSRLFKIHRSLGLLPAYGETPKEWRSRIDLYESESGTQMHTLAMTERQPRFPN